MTDTDLYVGFSCDVYDLDPASGAEQWRYNEGCSGGGGKTASLTPDGLWTRDSLTDALFDADTGDLKRPFSAGPIPAFEGTYGYFLNGNTLEGRDAATGTVLWTFTGDGQLTSAPVAANGFVYVGWPAATCTPSGARRVRSGRR